MSESIPAQPATTPLNPAPATPVREPAKKRRFSFVWLMPILALAVAAWVVWNNYDSRGPLVTVLFDSASGIQAGSTEVRIRDLRVGLVEEVGFSDGMEKVEARIRMEKNVARYVDRETRFWLVEPRVSARGVTGIGTLLSGVYIAADWDGVAGEQATRFDALEVPPLAASSEDGTRVVLRTRAGGQLSAGAPVLSSGIEVGRIGQPVLSRSGTTVTMDAFIAAPYDQRLTTNSRFWDASGLSVNVGAQGLAVKVNSLAALLEGGVNVSTPVTGGEPVEDGHVFEVFSTQEAARADAFDTDSASELDVSILLDSDVSGLGPGTAVRFRGVKVGEVEDVVGIAPEADAPEDATVQLRIDMSVATARLGVARDLAREALIEALRTRVARGLRARLGSEGLFGQSVVIEFVDLVGAEPAELEVNAFGRVLIPTAPAAKAVGESGVDGLVERVSNLPIEELMQSATEALAGVSTLTASADVVLRSEGIRKIPDTVERTVATVEETVGEVRSLVAGIREGGAIDSLNATLKSADAALQTADGALKSIEAIAGTADGALRSVDGAAAVVAGLPIAALTATATDTLAGVNRLTETANGVLAAPGLQDIPATAQQTLSAAQETIEGVGALVAALQDGGAVANLSATLQSADAALKTADVALNSVGEAATAVTGLPLADLANRANEAISGVSTLTQTANGVLAAEGVQQLPATAEQALATARTTLAEVSALVSQLRDGGAVANLNATLQSADSALKAVDNVAQGVEGQLNSALASVDAIAKDVGTAVTTANGVIANVDGIVTQFGAVVNTVDGAVKTVDEVVKQASTVVPNVDAALKSLNQTLQTVDGVAQTLPGLAGRLTATADGLQAVVNGYSSQGKVYGDLREALRQVSGAAESVRSLARSIERNPSSLIRGR